MPSSPYYFSAPSLNNLLPFTQEELKIYKTLKIKEIKKSISENETTIFYFNNQGNLCLQKFFSNKIEIGSIQYSYNKKGLPVFIESKEDNGNFICIDTISYNTNGIVTYYHSYEKVLKRNKVKSVNTRWLLTLKSSDVNFVTLIDTSFSETLFKVNNLNQVVKIQNTNGIDSIQKLVLGEKSINIYWYQNKSDTTFYIGKKVHYTLGLIDTIKIYDGIYKGKIIKDKIIFEYKKKLLKRIYNKNDYGNKTFYTYYSNGLLKDLPKEIVKLNQRYCDVTRFKYSFYKY
jgi:hypothetical protein